MYHSTFLFYIQIIALKRFLLRMITVCPVTKSLDAYLPYFQEYAAPGLKNNRIINQKRHTYLNSPLPRTIICFNTTLLYVHILYTTPFDICQSYF